MIRQRTERSLETGHGETRFSGEMSDGFFKIGYKPPAMREHIHGVTVRYEQSRDRFRMLVDLSRRHKTFGIEVSRELTPTTLHDDRPTELMRAMNDPAALARANRVLVASEGAYDSMSAVAIAAVMAGGYLLTHA